ncbi:MAG: 4-(cytidine 5'-diphospho)-2-C-methyl-D-erythritol kinase [Pseudomonadales bacterium]|nr:4-(cytidine 5'-diphospho)-2-C-methyl-D-erythritol kinase [Pseudomonadales bacterium]
MQTITLPAPAKLNLFLHITGQRENGYHDLQTVFHFLEIHDQLHFQIRDDDKIHLLTEFAGLKSKDNLIVKAAKALQEKTGCKKGVDIHIEKNLPMGGGIGGGSSNAATTLIALNQLWDTQLNEQQLKELGLKLGADVPIFIHGHTAWAEGIGESLSDINIDEKTYLLLIPDCHVSTQEIFSHSKLTRDSKVLRMAAFLEQGDSDLFRNDCETLVRKLYPEVNEALTVLSQFSQGARMTGTGACVFAAFDSEKEALAVQKKIPDTIKSLLTKGKNCSPLLVKLETSR